MHYVGVRELKNRLTYYLGLTKNGDNVIVTERGRPLAILHTVDTIEEHAGLEERLVSLAGKGLLKLPAPGKRPSKEPPKKAKGKAASRMLVEDRR